MRTIHYSKEKSTLYVLAEQNDDMSWHVPGWHQQLRPVEFRAEWTEDAPHPYMYDDGTGDDAPDPNTLVLAGTHTLKECETAESVRDLEASVPGVEFFEPGTGAVYRNLPVRLRERIGIQPGEEFPSREARLPLIAVIPLRT